MNKMHELLKWLEVNVRKPLEGSQIDKFVFSPTKKLYVSIRKQS